MHARRMSPPVLQVPSAIQACLFDLDGVLTDTASAHAEAWEEMFNVFLRLRATRDGIDGKQRFDGVRSFLASPNSM